MDAPVTAAERIAFDDAETFDEANHDLGAGEERAPETEQKPFPGMLAFAHEILGDDVFAAGREDELEAGRKFEQGAVERGGAADDAQREEEHREKGEEHVESDGLAESDAVWKDAAEATKEIFQYSVHRGRRRDYTGSGGNRARKYLRCSEGTRVLSEEQVSRADRALGSATL